MKRELQALSHDGGQKRRGAVLEEELVIGAIIIVFFLSVFAGLISFIWLFFISSRLKRSETKLSEIENMLKNGAVAFQPAPFAGAAQAGAAGVAQAGSVAGAAQAGMAAGVAPASQVPGAAVPMSAAAQNAVSAAVPQSAFAQAGSAPAGEQAAAPQAAAAGAAAPMASAQQVAQAAPQPGAPLADAAPVADGAQAVSAKDGGRRPAWMRQEDAAAFAAQAGAGGSFSQAAAAGAPGSGDTVRTVGDTVPPGASKPSAPAKPQSLETFFLGNIFNKLGALAIIIGMIIFVGIAAPLLTPELKIAAAYALGLAFISGGAFIHKRMPGMGEVLMGTGFAVLFIITYCSCSIFPVFSPNTALFISCILLASIYAVSVGMKRISMLVLAMVGGYSNLGFIDFSPSNEFMMTYLLLLNFLVLMGAYRCKAWKYLTTINLFLSLCFFIGQVAMSRGGRVSHAFFGDIFDKVFPAGGEGAELLFIATAAALWCMYAVYDLLRSKEDLVAFATESPLCYLNAALLTGFSVVVFHTKTIGLGLFLWVVSAGYAAFTYYHYKRSNYVINPYFNLMLLTHMAGTFFTFGETWRVPFLGAEAAALAFAASRLRYGNIPAWSVVYLLAAAASAFYAEPRAIYGGAWKDGLTHLDIFLCGAPCLFGWVCSFLMRTDDKRYDSHADSCSLLALTMLYAGVFIEMHSYMKLKAHLDNEIVLALYYYLLLAGIFSVQCLWMGRDRIYFKIAGFLGFFVTLPCLIVVSFCESGKMVPLLNVRTLCFALYLVGTIIVALKDKTGFFKTLAVFIGFCYVNSEALNLAAICNFESITTIFWILYAGAIILPGMFRHQKYLTYSGIFLVGLSCAKILIYDISELPGIYKLIIFMVMGFTLLVISFLYNKWHERQSD